MTEILTTKTTVYTLSRKTRHPIVTKISPNLNRLSKFFHCRKAY